jgi:putative transposase
LPSTPCSEAQDGGGLNALAEKLPNLADHLEENRADVLAFTAFPNQI